jgi:hypothetical protein
MMKNKVGRIPAVISAFVLPKTVSTLNGAAIERFVFLFKSTKYIRTASNYSLRMEQNKLLVERNDGVAYVPLNPSSKMNATENTRKGRMRHKMSPLLQV